MFQVRSIFIFEIQVHSQEKGETVTPIFLMSITTGSEINITLNFMWCQLNEGIL